MPAINMPEVGDFVEAAAKVPGDVSAGRNHLLHARPTTIDGEQRLVRWRADRMEAVSISIAWLDNEITEIDRP